MFYYSSPQDCIFYCFCILEMKHLGLWSLKYSKLTAQTLVTLSCFDYNVDSTDTHHNQIFGALVLLFNSTPIIWSAILNMKMSAFVRFSNFTLIPVCIAIHLHAYLKFLDGVKMVTWIELNSSQKTNCSCHVKNKGN